MAAQELPGGQRRERRSRCRQPRREQHARQTLDNLLSGKADEHEHQKQQRQPDHQRQTPQSQKAEQAVSNARTIHIAVHIAIKIGGEIGEATELQDHEADQQKARPDKGEVFTSEPKIKHLQPLLPRDAARGY